MTGLMIRNADSTPLRSVRKRSPLIERIALGILVLTVLMAVIGPWIAPHDPVQVNLSVALQAPNWEYWLGTDMHGRDVLSRILHGARLTLPATAIVLIATLVIGITVGTAAALGGRVVDEVLMRITDIGLSLPSLVLALGFAVALGPGLKSAVIAVIISWWPGYARLVRSVVRETRNQEYVESAIALGVSRSRLVFKHILANSLSPVYIQVTIDISAVMLVISGLSFVGAGAQAPSPEWGAMIADASGNLVNGWWALLFPGLALAIVATAGNLVGDWVRVKQDPTLSGGDER